MQVKKIKIGELALSEIINDINNGKLRIPQFQRDYVWEKPKTIALLNSVYNEFPIGSFFLWDAPKEYNHFYRQIEDFKIKSLTVSEDFSFILDGQQRLTSLYATIKGLEINGKDYSKICFDLDNQCFIDTEPDNQRFVSLSDFYGQNQLDIFDSLTIERKRAFQKCLRKFDNYPFSAIKVKEKSLEEVCDIFELINQGGKRLSLFDLIVASTWDTDFDLRKKINAFNDTVVQKGFGKIDYEIFTQCLSLIKRSSCTRTAQLKLRKEDIVPIWQDIVQACELAIDYMQVNLGVKTVAFLPYRANLTLLTYFFYTSNKRSVSISQRKVVESWFWRSAFSERYGVHTQAAIAEDKKIFDKLTQDKEPKVDFPVTITAETLIGINMGKKSAIKNGLLCLLSLKKPRHFKNNAAVPLQDSYFSSYNSPEKHHIFPKAYLNDNKIWEYNRLPNFCFIPAELNKEISNSKPSVYFNKFAKVNNQLKQALNSHLIPSNKDSGIWKDDYWTFLTQRAELIVKEVSKLTGVC